MSVLSGVIVMSAELGVDNVLGSSLEKSVVPSERLAKPLLRKLSIFSSAMLFIRVWSMLVLLTNPAVEIMPTIEGMIMANRVIAMTISTIVNPVCCFFDIAL